MDKHTLLIKTIKKSSLTKLIYKIFNWICPSLLVIDLVLYFVQKGNLNLILYIILIVLSLFLAIVILILYFQIKFYREIIDFLLNN